MARKKDLGGLAALAGMAYVASRDKADKTEKEYRSDPYGAMTQEQRDARRDINGRTLAEENAEKSRALGEIRDDDGTVSKLRRNTETGELYDPTGSNLTTAAPASKPTTSTAKRPAGGIENARDELLKRQGRPRDPRDAEMGMSRGTQRGTDDTINPDVKQRLKDDQYNPAVKQYRDDTYDPKVRRGMNKENLEATGEPFKKGGSVKGWGMARGARKAKTY
jgi:hypothetical protein